MFQKETLNVAGCCVKTAFMKKTENYMLWCDHDLLVHGCGENREWIGNYIWGHLFVSLIIKFENFVDICGGWVCFYKDTVICVTMLGNWSD